ncbi:MAG TPA: MaoC/PaaZ C-terminal domain-containing protein [Thermoleophilaceae bacterium]|jgi:acyl dehydratase
MEVRELDSQPRMRVLYPRAALGSVRGVLGGGGGEPELPGVELRLSGLEVDREQLAEYDRVCGFRLRDTLPATYPHVLAFPLSMELMTSGEFPFPVIGMVHVSNRIERLRPIGASERLDLRVWAEDLRPHDKGMQFDMRAEASASGEVAWRSWSTYLRRGGSSSSGADGARRDEPRPEPPRAQGQWKVPGDVGRAYAGVSGDSNPIHMHGLSARLFGMPRAIAHGMWLKARCLAALEGHLPEAYAADVSFKLPVLIPGTVSFASWPAAGGRAFALHDRANEKPHLSGATTPL